MNDSDLVSVSENGEGQHNYCSVCGAEPGQMCSDIDPSDPESFLGFEYGRKVHFVRLNGG